MIAVLGVQLILPKFGAYFRPRPGGYRRCSACRRVLPLSDYHRDRRAPAGHTLSCKGCRYRADTRWNPAPANERPPPPPDPLHLEALRRLALQTQAAKDGLPPPTFGPLRKPMLAIVTPPPRPFCPECDDRYSGAACPCGAVVHEARVDSGVVHLDVETRLSAFRARYRGRVDFALLEELLAERSSTDDAIAVEKALGATWITIHRSETVQAFLHLAERVRRAAQERRL